MIKEQNDIKVYFFQIKFNSNNEPDLSAERIWDSQKINNLKVFFKKRSII